MKPHREPITTYRPRITQSRPSNSARGGVTKLLSHSQTYDVHTGQVFKEIEVHASKRQRSDWIGEFKTPNLVKKRQSNATGPRSLFDMAKGTVARHMRGLSSHHLSGIPWEIAEQVWNEITDM
jgi:hypothetical protein